MLFNFFVFSLFFGGYKEVYPLIVPSILSLSYVVDSERYYKLSGSLMLLFLCFLFFAFWGLIRGFRPLIVLFVIPEIFSRESKFLLLLFVFLLGIIAMSPPIVWTPRRTIQDDGQGAFPPGYFLSFSFVFLCFRLFGGL